MPARDPRVPVRDPLWRDVKTQEPGIEAQLEKAVGGLRGRASPTPTSKTRTPAVPVGRALEIFVEVLKHTRERHIRLVEVFFTVDTDGSGEMDRNEWDEALELMGLNLSGAASPQPDFLSSCLDVC